MNFLALMYSLIINLLLHRKSTEPSQEEILSWVLIKPLSKLIQKISVFFLSCAYGVAWLKEGPRVARGYTLCCANRKKWEGGGRYLKSTNYEITLVLSRSKKAYKIRREMKKSQNVIFEYSEIPYSLIILFWVVFVSVKWNLIKYYNLYSTLWWVIYFFLLIWNQLRSNCFINLIIKSFYKLSLLRVLINRSFSTDLNLCPVDNTIGFPNTY